jgi:predicted esterase
MHRINANGECLAIQTYYPNDQLPQKNSRLLIFIHGDGGGGPSDYLKFQATKFIDAHTTAVVVIRPGYYDSYDNYSTGESYAFACNGYPCDGDRENTIATLAATIQELKEFYQPSCTILVGHSGGGIMSGIILGKYPHLADGAVLASITNNVHQWATQHGWGNWPNSLSPHDWINKIPQHTFVYVVSGTADENTYPNLAREYYISLKKAGIDTHFISVSGGTHNSVVIDNVTDFDKAITDALAQCHS